MTWGNVWRKRMFDMEKSGHDVTRKRGLAERRLTQVLDIDTIPVERADILPADAAAALLASVGVDRTGAVAQALIHLANFRGTCDDDTKWPLQFCARDIWDGLDMQGVVEADDRLRSAVFVLGQFSKGDSGNALQSIRYAQQSLESITSP